MKQLLNFLAGLVIPLICYAAGGYLLFAMTFTLSSQTLTEWENTIALFFYCVLTGVLVFSVISFKQFKLNRKALSLGILLSLIPVLFILIKLSILYFGQFNYYQRFDKLKWIASDTKPFNMAKTLVKNNELVGLDRKEVITKLGYFKETARTDGQTLIYYTDKSWMLYIDLKRDTVIKAYLYELGFD
mgnify:CR=1 FL=1